MLSRDHKLLTSAMEDYLEMIYRNIGDGGYFRINELAEKLNVRASSATKMVQKLGDAGLIQYEKYGVIVLTPKGKTIGEFLLNRHTLIESFLTMIGIEENLLTETELIEHNISINTLNHLKILSEFFTSNANLLVMYRDYLSRRLVSEDQDEKPGETH